MSHCQKCGSSLNQGDLFCVTCGNKVGPDFSHSATISMREKGSELEDAVANYFRHLGFETQARVKMKDRSDVFHEIDVIASKRESFGTITVAVECKNVKGPMDIKEIRNFNDKLTALHFTKGIFVSTGGFTSDALAHAKSLGMELWNPEDIEQKLGESNYSEQSSDLLHEALPVNPLSYERIEPKHLSNFKILSGTLQLAYRPVYFANLHCFSEYMVRGNSVDLECDGTIVVDAVTGGILDSKTEGMKTTLPDPGVYVKCYGLPTQTVNMSEMPRTLQAIVVPSRIELSSAKEIAREELVKNITLEYTYHTTRTRGRKLLKPRKRDVDVTQIEPVKIPVLTATYRFKDRTYVRTCIAATGAITLDQTAKCLLCGNASSQICENCGTLACVQHTRICTTCGKRLCTQCISSKGIISKTYYCSDHLPR